MKLYISKVLVVAIFTVFSLYGKAQVESGIKFAKLLNWIEDYYVDTVNVDKLADKAIVELLQRLDPHSSYATREEVDALNEPLKGNFEGIGITFSIFRDTIMVLSPLEDGPSAKAGIKAGDRIIKIDNVSVVGPGIGSDDVFSRLRGKKGSTVELTVKRKGQGDLSLKITRDRIPIHSVEAAYKVSGNIGYVKVSRFSSNTMYEFRTALAKLKRQNVNSLILDLSGNGGGFLDVAVSLADEFIDKEKLIVYTQGNHNPKKEYTTSGKGNFEKGRLVVIIDESSASASEIFAGAIQDWDRGILVGRRSFGKGLVQRPLMFPDGSMVRLTIARYYTPTGRLIQKSYSNGYQDYSRDLMRRINDGELTSESKNNHFTDTVKYYTLEKKRIVYGGGGIMPDVFVPIDTLAFKKEIRPLVSRGILNRFVIEYVDQNREMLAKKYRTFDAFNDKFPANEPLKTLFENFYKEENPGKVLSLSAEAENYVYTIIKAYIARDIWGNSEFYQVFNETENEFRTARDVLENWQAYLVKLHLK